MGYLEGRPHHPPPKPRGVWGSCTHMPVRGHASNTRSPAKNCIPSPPVYGRDGSA